MRTIQSAMTLTLLAFVVTGCLPNTVAQSSDVEEIKRRLAVVEQATISSQSDQSLDKRLESQSARLADMQAEITALRVELQRLSGVNEDAAHQRNQLHELLTMFHPMVAGVTLPGVGIIFLILTPYLDRNPSNKPEDRKFVISIMTVHLMFWAVLVMIGSFFRGPGFNFVLPWVDGLFFEL